MCIVGFVLYKKNVHQPWPLALKSVSPSVRHKTRDPIPKKGSVKTRDPIPPSWDLLCDRLPVGIYFPPGPPTNYFSPGSPGGSISLQPHPRCPQSTVRSTSGTRDKRCQRKWSCSNSAGATQSWGCYASRNMQARVMMAGQCSGDGHRKPKAGALLMS